MANSNPDILIRRATTSDRPAMWGLLEPIVRTGETLALAQDADEAAGMSYWSSPEKVNFLAETRDGALLGSSYIRANQQGGGAHIANCGYITSQAARGRGVARALCNHSIQYCRQAGFKAIQFNFVVSTNAPAVHLWQDCGFRILARLPGAFHHPREGFVDALVMWKDL